MFSWHGIGDLMGSQVPSVLGSAEVKAKDRMGQIKVHVFVRTSPKPMYMLVFRYQLALEEHLPENMILE